MSDTFFCRKAELQIKELIDELYKRLGDSRRLLKMYDEDPDLARRGYDKGYAQGIREEIGYLVRLLDKFERS
jgi:hypothetical protein